MPMAAPRARTSAPTTAPAPARPAAKPAARSAAAVAPTRVRVPPPSVVPALAGPAISLKDPKAAKDPRFQKVMDKLQKSAAKTKEHPPAGRKAAEAQAAAQPPTNEKLAGAQASQVDTMQSAEGKKPESSSFLALLRAEIEKVMPKTLGDTENFMKGDQKQQLKGAMTGNVNQQKEEAAGGIKAASSQPPDPSKIEGKEVAPLLSESAPLAPPAVGAAEAVPAPKPESEVSLQQSKQDADKQLKDAEVTPEQLQKANDPRFSAVLTAKSAVDKQADSAPKQFRAGEQKTLTQEAAKAVADEKQGLSALQGEKSKSGAAVKLKQLNAKQKDEARRKEVTDTIEKIYNETKQTVEAKLASLETEVSGMFDKGIEAALTKMTNYVNQQRDAYKAKRYGGIGGDLLWVKDKLFNLPDEVNVFVEEGRKVFTQELDALVVSIANLVEIRLKEAKDEIAKGQKRIREYVQSLPKDLQAVGKAAEKEVAGRFEELSKGVDEKKDALAQKLAQRYKEATDKANEQLDKMKEENKGLLSGLVEKLGEVVKILRDFKERVSSMIKKGKETIMLIVADPIGFLKNLLNAVKKGIQQFVDNIWTHLKAGFMAWLFGSLAEAGIEIPSDFSLGSILKLVLQVLGLTYERIRAKAVKLIGERNVMLIEKAWELISALIKGGPAALWEKIKEFLGNLKEMVINAIQDWVVTTVIKAAITKLATMFNPVGAIVQAIITIYNTVMFFIERINQILAMVEAVINSVHKIATGDIGSAANWVEQAMARTIPVIIGFLARLLGLSGITDKIKEIIKKIQGTVDKAIDKLIEKIVGGIKNLFAGGRRGDKDKDKETAGSKALKEKVKTELSGKTITDPKQAEGLISGIYQKYKPEGLKGIKLIPDPKTPNTFDVMVSASLTEKIAELKKPEKLIEIALAMIPFTRKTTMYVFYDGNKPFPSNGEPFVNKGKKHAEEQFVVRLPELIELINTRRSKGDLKTPPGQSVQVTLDINRTPCDLPNHQCATKLIKASAVLETHNIKLRINAVSLYQKTGPLYHEVLTTSETLQKLLKAKIEITPLRVWAILKEKLQAQGVQDIRVSSRYEINLNLKTGEYEAAEADLAEQLKDAAEKLKEEGKLTKVTPQGEV